MMNYTTFTLDNGLQVVVHEDHTSEMAVVNMLYKVGSRNESPGKTGLAHFFEHLMFSGSRHVPEFDSALERVGGSSNAFTNTDITNYYISLPAVNLETALWLESDRMLHLNLNEQQIRTQKQVVTEEFKQRYLNQPYGDAMHHVRRLAFEKHPYRWPTIGEQIEDIEQFEKADLTSFYRQHYSPDNAVLCIAGKVRTEEVKDRVSQWFGDIPGSLDAVPRPLTEPEQLEKRTRRIRADVPTDALYKVFRIPGRMDQAYLACDLITDILSVGRSSVLEQKLIKNGSVFASCHAYVLGNVDPGLMVFTGKMEKGVAAEKAEEELDKVINRFKQDVFPSNLLQKIKNQMEAMETFESVSLLGRAMKLAYYTYLGNPSLIQAEFDQKLAISAEEIMEASRTYLREDSASVVYYTKNNGSLGL